MLTLNFHLATSAFLLKILLLGLIPELFIWFFLDKITSGMTSTCSFSSVWRAIWVEMKEQQGQGGIDDHGIRRRKTNPLGLPCAAPSCFNHTQNSGRGLFGSTWRNNTGLMNRKVILGGEQSKIFTWLERNIRWIFPAVIHCLSPKSQSFGKFCLQP